MSISLTLSTIKRINKSISLKRSRLIVQSTVIAAFLSFLSLSTPLFALTDDEQNVDTELETHIELVELALKTDSYNKRCRGMSVSKALNQVNRLYVTKYSLTVNNFIKNYINPDVKNLKIERQHEFNKSLNQQGGCQVAKSKGVVKKLKADFKTHYEQAENSSWYPE